MPQCIARKERPTTTAARRVQACEAKLVSLSPDLVARLHELTVAIRWLHRAENLTFSPNRARRRHARQHRLPDRLRNVVSPSDPGLP